MKKIILGLILFFSLYSFSFADNIYVANNDSSDSLKVFSFTGTLLNTHTGKRTTSTYNYGNYNYSNYLSGSLYYIRRINIIDNTISFSSFSYSTTFLSFFSDGSFLYSSVANGNFLKIDLSNFSLVSSISVGPVHVYHFNGGYLYVTGFFSGVKRIDLSNFVIKDSFLGASTACSTSIINTSGVYVLGKYVYLSCMKDGSNSHIYTLNINDLSLYSTYTSSTDYFYSSVFSGDYFYLLRKIEIGGISHHYLSKYYYSDGSLINSIDLGVNSYQMVGTNSFFSDGYFLYLGTIDGHFQKRSLDDLSLVSDLNLNFSIYSIGVSFSSQQKNKICEDYTSSIPTLTNQQKYNLQGQIFTNSGFIQNESSGKKVWGFWFNKNSNGTGSFLNYFINNLDDFNDVRFYNSSDVEQTSTGGILQTFTNSGYLKLENYFFAKGTVEDPLIYLNTYNKFQKINVKSNDNYAYRLYRKVEGEWVLILKNCVTNTICDISQSSSTLWYNSYDEILIVPFSTAGYVKFTDYRIDDIEIFSYTSEYLSYPVCYYDDGSIDINGEEFTQEQWEEYKQEEIKNSEAIPTSYCNELNFFQYIKDPVCLSSGLSTWFQKNIGSSSAYQYFMKFLNFISYKIEPNTQISIFFIKANLNGFDEYILDLNPDNLNFENYSNYNPDFQTDNGKILLFLIKGFFIIFFYLLIFAFLYVVFFLHNFIFNGFLKVVKMAFPNLLDFDFKEKMNFISYIALIPLIAVFIFLFNTFLLDYIVIFKSIFTQIFNILGLIFDTFYGLLTDDFGGFIIFFNIVNTYMTGAFLIALFALILIKFGRF